MTTRHSVTYKLIRAERRSKRMGRVKFLALRFINPFSVWMHKWEWNIVRIHGEQVERPIWKKVVVGLWHWLCLLFTVGTIIDISRELFTDYKPNNPAAVEAIFWILVLVGIAGTWAHGIWKDTKLAQGS